MLNISLQEFNAPVSLMFQVKPIKCFKYLPKTELAKVSQMILKKLELI